MNGTTGTADLLLGMFDARQRELGLAFEAELRLLTHRVSNHLVGYFLFCLFGLAILSPFPVVVLCKLCKQACFSSFYVAKFGRFLCINKFLQVGTLDFK